MIIDHPSTCEARRRSSGGVEGRGRLPEGGAVGRARERVVRVRWVSLFPFGRGRPRGVWTSLRGPDLRERRPTRGSIPAPPRKRGRFRGTPRRASPEAQRHELFTNKRHEFTYRAREGTSLAPGRSVRFLCASSRWSRSWSFLLITALVPEPLPVHSLPLSAAVSRRAASTRTPPGRCGTIHLARGERISRPVLVAGSGTRAPSARARESGQIKPPSRFTPQSGPPSEARQLGVTPAASITAAQADPVRAAAATPLKRFRSCTVYHSAALAA